MIHLYIELLKLCMPFVCLHLDVHHGLPQLLRQCHRHRGFESIIQASTIRVHLASLLLHWRKQRVCARCFNRISATAALRKVRLLGSWGLRYKGDCWFRSSQKVAVVGPSRNPEWLQVDRLHQRDGLFPHSRGVRRKSGLRSLAIIQNLLGGPV